MRKSFNYLHELVKKMKIETGLSLNLTLLTQLNEISKLVYVCMYAHIFAVVKVAALHCTLYTAHRHCLTMT